MTPVADPRIAVITIVSGRHEHLRRQLQGFAVATPKPTDHVIVAMNDPAVHEIAARFPQTRVLDLLCDGVDLELARARNLGAHTAIAGGADLLVFLDVDCIPGLDLIEHYRRSARALADERLLLCGPVTYLAPDQVRIDQLSDYTDPHPARPNPGRGETVIDADMNLFWSLSFAITPDNWQLLGGFHTGYRGYGGEDTDFAMTARHNSFRIAWLGGAHAYHQYHPVSDPPVEHLDDILRNATLFHRRWGWWPMPGWLDAFEEQGLIFFDPDTDMWVSTATTAGVEPTVPG
jgi:GT2 family glycosyltransferase